MAAAEILDGVNDFSLFRSAVNLRLRDWDQHIIRRVIRSCRIHVRKGQSSYSLPRSSYSNSPFHVFL